MNSKLNAALETLKKNGVRVYTPDTLPECEIIPTSSLIINRIMSGGFKTRRITQLFSRPGVGKTVLSYTAINNALHKFPDSIALILDIECRFDEDWARNFITDDVWDRLLVLREEYIETAGNSVNAIIKQLNGIHISCIVVDSIAAANTARYKGADMEKMEVAGSAMGVGKFIRAMVQIAEKNNTAIIILNQLRDDMDAYGPSIGRTNGGWALKHSLDADYYLRNLSQKDTKDLASNSIEEKTELGEVQQIAVGVAIKCMKGKAWSQVGKTVFYRRATDENEVGFDTFNEVIKLALATGIITKPSEYSTTFFYSLFPEDEKTHEHKIVDKKKLMEFLKNNPNVFDALKKDVENSDVIDEQVETDNFVEDY